MRDHRAEVASQANRFARLRSIAPRGAARGNTQVGAGTTPRRVVRPREQVVRTAAELGGALLVVAAASWPLVFSSSTFNNDWLNHLWYMWHQSIAIREHHLPSLFLDYSQGVLYPIYAFYGGTLYALVGALSLLLGNIPLQTYVLTYLLGFFAVYGGWYWTARIFGVRGWTAHVPGLVFVTSASYLTTIYALGDWPEFLSVSMMPLMIAAAISSVRNPRLGSALALTVSSVVFFGSHLLTVIWGSTILVLVTGAILLLAPGVRSEVTKARVLRVTLLVLPALLVSAWFLWPTIAYESHTLIAYAYPHARALLRQTLFTVAAHNLFSFSRSPSPGSIVSLSLPILAIAWVLLSLAILAWRGIRGTWMRVLLVITGATTVLLVVMAHAGLILALPRMYAALQFSFRLESFVLLGISGAMVSVLVMAKDGGSHMRRWTWLLAPIAAVSVLGALEQTVEHPHGKARSLALASYLRPPPERFGQFDYLDYRLAQHELPVQTERQLPLVLFPASSIVSNGSASQVIEVPPSRLVATNIRGGPDLVEVRGARIVGLDAQNDDVLEVANRGTATVSVGAADHLPIVAGRLISLIALGILLAQLGWLAARAVRARRPAANGSPPTR
jgi:hypothetical protein